ncbi:phosphate/phosphite/phosphonate ABC transporter substrate-binding protein [Gulosibacter molinativorax]|uniref:Phosphate/phosphite/phosphonate ABC transporter substrate-binding protein n=1 Tax=Gulosibacter molinativorax TaxID=256821 RepID=A0ABT7C681_9MICO|nr:phosphate/phosphite/phosphonate ABC transporter substrate-binding protein [Gulosibacter molinativorax]MDJ1370690.1 phosphate/phosphite/phosphonate ABC transporter substrate-binding protein [Gulosibacter molinativorax]QUY63283.1 Phosphate/phosphite/phosphonate ABC transporter, periplasmic binding protein [Gulosibacter molinativorax]
MHKPLIATSLLTAAALTLTGCASDTASSTDATGSGSWPESITISLVPSTEGENLAEALDPLTTYLSENLGIEVNGVVATDYAATVEALGADQAQVIITDAGSLYQAINQHDAKLILRDVRFGATDYASVAYTNNPDKYCDDEPVMATYAANGEELSYCNGIETAAEAAAGQGPAAEDALKKIDEGTAVALQAATSPAGYQYPVVAMQAAGIDTDNGIKQVPVEGNNNAVLAVYNGDAEVSFGFWDARSTVLEEAPDVAEKVVAFSYTEMIPNGGVAVTQDLPEDLVAQLAELMDGYAQSSAEAETVMFDLVGLSDWTAETESEQIDRYGEILKQFQN